MLLSQTTKGLSLALVMALSLNAAPADKNGNCGKQAFNISINETATLNDVLTQLSDMCRFSVVAKDAQAADELKQTMNSVSIKDLSLREIFNILLTENNLDYEFSHNSLKISALQTKTFKVDYITSIREGRAIMKTSADAVPTEVGQDKKEDEPQSRIETKETFDFWKNIKDEMTLILNNGTEKYVATAPIINPQSGMITVTGMKSQVARAEKYIKEMQRRMKKQVLLDVHIIEVQLSNSYQTGIDWSKFQLGIKSSFGMEPQVIPLFEKDKDGRNTTTQKGYRVLQNPSENMWGYKYGSGQGGQHNSAWTLGASLNFNIDGMMNFLEEKGKAKVVSSPKVTTINNQPAMISVGDTINYNLIDEIQQGTEGSNGSTSAPTASYKSYSVFIGILLNILPEISDDNKIMLRINPSVSDFKYQEDNTRYNTTIKDLLDPRNASEYSMRGIAPDTRQKKISTVVTVNDGDTVILGGLISQHKGKDQNGVPLLRDLPLIGGLFESKKDILKTTELVFVVTPHLIDGGNNLATDLKELGYSKTTANE
ncbi:MAG: pilus (MSHA type) biogenesis protein MshL [Campylobacter sp.]